MAAQVMLSNQPLFTCPCTLTLVVTTFEVRGQYVEKPYVTSAISYNM